MVITCQGGNYFKFQAGPLTLLVDPENQRSFKGAQIILNTAKPAPAGDGEASTEPLWIEHQGEYETKGVIIKGWSAGNDGKTERTVYRLNFDEVDIVLLGGIREELDPKIIHHLKGTQVVVAPAGGKPSLSQAAVAKIVKEINPSLIIPSLYKDIKPFLKEFRKTACETETKLVFKAKDLKPAA